MNRVKYVLNSLGPNEVTDRKMMYDWLFEKFRDYSGIKFKMEKIKEALEGGEHMRHVKLHQK